MTTATAAWTETFVEAAGGKVQVLQAGQGEPLVILPDDVGVAGWLPIHEALSQRFSLHLISHPGFGKSERPTWARELRDIAALEQLVLRSLGLTHPGVLGFGFGGWLAAEMEVLAPGTFRRMALVAPFGVKPPSGDIYDQFLVQGPAYVRTGFHDPGAFTATYGTPGTDGELSLDLREQWEINREMTARVAWRPYLFDRALEHLLPEVRLPVLVAWGAQDRVIPLSAAQRWAELVPGARLEIIEACGHYPDVEQPLALAKILDSFLA